MAKTYKSAGVSIDSGDEFVNKLKLKVRSTFSKSVLSDIGLFGAFYDAKFEDYKHPVLVSSVDGVGTKLKIAFMLNKHDTIGQDLVNHCVNDIAVCGAAPLFFLDYYAAGKLNQQVGEQIMDGLVKACRENNCALIGGETAEMPGIYHEDEYDLAGTIVGIIEKAKIINGKKVKEDDVLIGLPSTGLHTNGYSLARSVLFEKYEVDDFIDELGMRLGECLLTTHRSYLNPINAIKDITDVHAIAHITGGGIKNNTMRLIPKGLELEIDWFGWDRYPIFNLIQRLGEVPEEEMRRTFNLGIGLVIVVSKRGSENILKNLIDINEQPIIIGQTRSSN
ncbi:MAG: phosphoribosylformylglycinamidine cyclo-ligase [Bacteroidota bacterium]|nr:phosphoribosylformylglycinamidine cyclo-ligase [Bacteroidota bacterium]